MILIPYMVATGPSDQIVAQIVWVKFESTRVCLIDKETNCAESIS